MSGLRKAKKYDWKDSNMALFGSDTEKQVKKDSAMTEPAWQGAGEEEGLKIWRIEKFQVVAWPTEDYGSFFNGDSYIILNTYKVPDSDALNWDVHFWIGQQSSQDEYGTAAYKTVELDTYLDDGPVQHREVGGHESTLFKSYFEEITYMKGGCDTGFRHVEPDQYEARLFVVRKEGRRVNVSEIPRRMKNLTSNDVFILDLGKAIYQWNGKDCSADEKFKAAQYCQKLESNRAAQTEVLEEGSVGPEHEFVKNLDIEVGDVEDDDEDEPDAGERPSSISRISDASGSLEFTEVQSGDITRDTLKSEDVFLIEHGNEITVWVGSEASPAEKKNAMAYAHTYLKNSDAPLRAVAVMQEGKHTREVTTIFGN